MTNVGIFRKIISLSARIDGMLNNKVVIGMIVAVVVLLGGGVFLMSRSQTNTPMANSASAEELKITATDHVKGATTGKITLVEYADFQCPACGAYQPLITQLASDYSDKLSIVLRNYPLPMHKNAEAAARAAEAAGKQNKYWEMHDLLFANQKDWSDLLSPAGKFGEYAKSLNLDVDQFQKDQADSTIQDKINADVASGNRLNVNSTPTFFLGGEKIPNPQSIGAFKTLVDAALLKQPLTSTGGQKVHEHADLKIYLNGKALDLSAAKYQSTDDKPLDPDLHLHDNNGTVVHKHKTGKTMTDFFKSLKMDLTDTCLTLDTGTKYCTSTTNSLKFMVNGVAKTNFPAYEFADLDRILISYGPTNQNLDSQLSSVTDLACVYSETCPERGKPPTEGCVGGLGSDCVEE